MVMKIVPDTSVIIHGNLAQMLEKGELKDFELVIPIAVLDELQAQASKGRDVGFVGLDELKKIRKLCEEKKIKIKFAGERPSLEEIKLAKSGRIDALIRDVVKVEGGKLLTADYVQALVAEAEGIPVEYIAQEVKTTGLKFEKFFTSDTLSVHLKEGVTPLVKRGKPGKFELIKFGKEKLTAEEIEEIIKEILEAARVSDEGHVEIARAGAMVLQLGDYRIAIARPPFSDGLEVTIVRPIVKLRLEDYRLSEKLMKRLRERAEGVLIAGPPGSGKCLPSYTPILLDSGAFKTAEEIFTENKKEVHLMSLNSFTTCSQKVSKFYKRSCARILRLKTRTGRKIELTPEHPVLTIDKGRLRWSPLHSLREGSWIGTPRRLKVKGKKNQKLKVLQKMDQDFTYLILKNGKEVQLKNFKGNPNLIKKIVLRKSSKKSLPISPVFRLSADLCELLGYLWSKGTGGKYEITSANKKIVNRFFYLTEKLFGIPRNKFTKYPHKKYTYTLNTDGTLIEFLKIFNYPMREKARSLDIPTILLTASDEEIAALLRAYFDGDGYVGKRGIEIATASLNAAQKLFYLLLRLDILPILKTKSVNGKKYYRISISGRENVRTFHEKIGSLIKERNFKKPESHKHNPNIDVIPAGDLLISTYESLNLTHDRHELRKSNYSLNRLRKHFKILARRYIRFLQLKNYFKILESFVRFLDRLPEILEKCKKTIKWDHKGSFFRKYHLDHNSISLWLKGKRKPKLSTIIKLLDSINREYGGFEDELKVLKKVDSQCIKTIRKIYRRMGFKAKDLKLNVANSSITEMIRGRIPLILRILKPLFAQLWLTFIERVNMIEENLAHLKLLCSGLIFWDKIESIEETDHKGKVFDFEIERFHNFIAGITPFFVHNSTFASSIAEFYKDQGKIVKTLESPKDLQVGPEITQYGPLEGDFEKTADILLLVRPDYSVYDEVRKTKDFEIFSDMRLAGVGMIGVVHASNAIDAIQRFIMRTELGMIPHIIDTVIFIKEGEVKKVYELNLTVRVPTGMTEADLARPLVEIRDFETGKLEYEIYTFGEENIVVPVATAEVSPMKKLAAERIREEIERFDPRAQVELVSDTKAVVRVDNDVVARLIGKEGNTISAIEKKLGIHIEVEPKLPAIGKEAEFETSESGNSIEFRFNRKHVGKVANFYVEDKFLFSATVGKKGNIRIGKSSDVGEELLRAIVNKKRIKVLI